MIFIYISTNLPILFESFEAVDATLPLRNGLDSIGISRSNPRCKSNQLI
jgi:hypothetical protein